MENTTDDLFHNIFVYITKDTVIDPSLPPKLSKYGAVVALNLNKRVCIWFFLIIIKELNYLIIQL